MNEAAEKQGQKVFGMMFNQRTNCVYRKNARDGPQRPAGELGERGQLDHTTGTAPRSITTPAAGGPPGRGRGAACCSINAPPARPPPVDLRVSPKTVQAFCQLG